MVTREHILKLVVAAAILPVLFSLPIRAEEERTAELLERLKRADENGSQIIAEDLLLLWSRSGSPSMDLLLKRGRDAMAADKLPEALDHFTALTDHAPDFAEGWMARATVLYRLEYYGAAMQDLQRTLALNPDHFAALFGAGVIAYETGRPELADQFFGAVATIHPHFEDLSRLRQEIDKEAGRTDL
jgi:tetratricopeptide (TPR) repeat protein